MLCHIFCHTFIREHSGDFCPTGATRHIFMSGSTYNTQYCTYCTIGSVHEVHTAIYSAAKFDLIPMNSRILEMQHFFMIILEFDQQRGSVRAARCGGGGHSILVTPNVSVFNGLAFF